jgi:malonate-semialdehyde dehydrogenase (acetylating) / methylmalonate-semialdehyde dehydrogenase
MRDIASWIDGRQCGGESAESAVVFDPNSGQPQARVNFVSMAQIDAAVAAAQRAQAAWSAQNPQRRARVLFEFRQLVEAHMGELSALLSSEHGKVRDDAKGDIQRGLDVIEFACGIPQLLKGEYTEGAGPGIDVYSMRQPLGVVAGIAPFNFPAMIPMWMFGVAIAAGNAFILKPSEKDPSVPLRLAELLTQAGAPNGLLNVVQGGKHAVDALLQHPGVRAISFVGSSDVAHYVYRTAATHGKRVQAMGGAKNHAIVLPDANLAQTVRDVVGAAYGSAGERCMALPVVVAVGKQTADELRERLVSEIASLKIGASSDAGADYGPLISAEHRRKVIGHIETGIREGADLVVDGRPFTLPGFQDGFFLGPTLFDRVTPDMQSYQDEIFGPVLQLMRAATFEEALELPSRHQYGNGVAIFTGDGRAAREFAARVDVGMVGINVPIPVPVAYHSFGGWKRSAFGDLNQYGTEGLRFWTRVKTVTARWPDGAAARGAFVMPTMR